MEKLLTGVPDHKFLSHLEDLLHNSPKNLHINLEDLDLDNITNHNDNVYVMLCGQTEDNLYMVNAFYCLSFLRYFKHNDHVICYYLGDNEKPNQFWSDLFEPLGVEWRNLYSENLQFKPSQEPKFSKYGTGRIYAILNTEYYNYTMLDPDCFPLRSHHHLIKQYDTYLWQMDFPLLGCVNETTNPFVNAQTLDFIFSAEKPTAVLNNIDVVVMFARKTDRHREMLSLFKFWTDNADFFYRYAMLEMNVWHYAFYKVFHKGNSNFTINPNTTYRGGNIITNDLRGWYFNEDDQPIIENRAGNCKPYYCSLTKKVNFPFFEDDLLVDLKKEITDKLNFHLKTLTI